MNVFLSLRFFFFLEISDISMVIFFYKKPDRICPRFRPKRILRNILESFKDHKFYKFIIKDVVYFLLEVPFNID